MTRDLETADTIVKLSLAITVVIFYFAKIITGLFATALMILGVIVLAIFLAKVLYARIFMD
jgi:hypothetical protein